MHESGDFSDDGLDAFEDSVDESNLKKKNTIAVMNKPYDEMYEVSQDLSIAESYDGRQDTKQVEKERKLKNDKYDEIVEVSQSMGQSNTFEAKATYSTNGPPVSQVKSRQPKVLNKPFDEEHEFSASGSDESIDTIAKKAAEKNKPKNPSVGNVPKAESQSMSLNRTNNNDGNRAMNMSSQPKQNNAPAPTQSQAKRYQEGDDHSSIGDDDHDESYENIEGAYNSNDYIHLNVPGEVRDLFQYIDRYKPQEVELMTNLKCFIPEYIPTIGEMDAFIKIPRPDDVQDDLGLKFLDEPSTGQSDPTVLELQLRAMSKKVQYGDIVVRSIEDASKNPAAIDKWIQSISDLHRSKPPPQVHYKRNMPEIEKLMEEWPEDFENALRNLSLPSPDLDLSIAEYAKILCSILDIPTYENPIESLHLMFSLYMDFKNNPHFQQAKNNIFDSDAKGGPFYGDADVMEIGKFK